jgi:hypothetical protein
VILKAPGLMDRRPEQDAIPVTLAPQLDRQSSPAIRAPKSAPATRAAKTPAVIAKKDRPVAAKELPSALRESPPPAEKIREEPPPIAREPIAEQTVVAERTLPSVMDLLPSATYST